MKILRHISLSTLVYPFILIVMMISLYEIFHSLNEYIVGIGVVVFTSVLIFLWQYVIKVFKEITDMFILIFSQIADLKSEMKQIRAEFKNRLGSRKS